MTDKEFLNNWFNLDCSKEGQNLVILNLDNQLAQNIPDIFLSWYFIKHLQLNNEVT